MQSRFLFFLVPLVLLFAFSAHAEFTFVMGEDAISPTGLVFSVNSISQRPLTSGFSGSAPKNIVEISITIVNMGRSNLQIEPEGDFLLVRNGVEYPPVSEAGAQCIDRPFSIAPGTQSRGTLFFHIEASADKTDSPVILVFLGGESPLKILCDQETGRIFEKSRNGSLNLQEGLILSRFFLRGRRFEEAKVLLLDIRSRFASAPEVLLNLAAAEKALGNKFNARTYLDQTLYLSDLTLDDSINLARQAFDLGQYSVCAQVLEPLASEGKLHDDTDLLLLAKAWYFDHRLEQSRQMLMVLKERGMRDASLYFTLGNIADKSENLNDAITWWDLAVTVDPNYYEALFNLGVVYYRLRNENRAKECWQKVLTLNPDRETRELAIQALDNIDD